MPMQECRFKRSFKCKQMYIITVNNRDKKMKNQIHLMQIQNKRIKIKLHKEKAILIDFDYSS